MISSMSAQQASEKICLFREGSLLPLDGTGSFQSQSIHSENCCQKTHRDNSVSYDHQMLAGIIVYPDQKVVLPFSPEPIMKNDDSQKNECERH
jgi:hypothetical protein